MTSPQPPKTDFLALTHGQEWVTFYESFDKLVQDHLSRSSDLLRRAMSLPEVADREVAQVRDELEGRLSAERERTSSVLTDLKAQIGNSHRLASTLAMSIGSLMTDLHTLTIRVDEALQSSATPAAPASGPSPSAPLSPSAPSAPIAPSGLLSSTLSSVVPPTVGSISGASAGVLPGTGGLSSTPGIVGITVTPGEAPALSETDLPTGSGSESTDLDTAPVDVAGSAGPDDAPVADVADLAGAVDAGDETPLDLSAIAEAEAATTDDGTGQAAVDASSEVGADGEAGDASPEASERQRPHWLSVTRVGASRP